MARFNPKHTIGPIIGVVIAALLLWAWDTDEKKPVSSYYAHQGPVFGTYYNIRYEAETDMEAKIKTALQDFDNSLSLFNPHSILSAVNDNRDTTTNTAFETMWAEAERVYVLSNGAFDVTVAPLVKAFGFGRKSDQYAVISSQTIDSLREFVGFEKVQLIDHKVVKTDPRVQIDGGAVAK